MGNEELVAFARRIVAIANVAAAYRMGGSGATPQELQGFEAVATSFDNDLNNECTELRRRILDETL